VGSNGDGFEIELSSELFALEASIRAGGDKSFEFILKLFPEISSASLPYPPRANYSGRSILGDVTVRALSGLRCLCKLDLGGSNVTDAGLLSLRASKLLMDLNLSRCRQLTDSGLEAFFSNDGLFDAIDIDGDGFIDREELALALSQGLHLDHRGS